ncbi:TetR/AcrR family transcriptional regulator [Noviherbaspirillum sedimenti]|uniref:TetR family transcriptional regulator n=1 Tax=Noviherbaspirillum sedimenti TaxID=2320865 RepID=A0A3A3G4F8_9BURK|nr:TetR/AcrR family transcriptional regulator [Noviherbaspirillum sedimenti]RJG03358.1 TetR family transcriptional regulator [Noviherbaspirillum sedimenti]
MPRIVDHDQRRAELAKAARAIVASEGIEALTIARVAEATGYSTGVVNHYFSNKRQMLLHTYISTVEQAQARLEAQLARSSLDLDACLKAFLPIDEEQQHEWLLWFAFWGMAITDQELAMAQRRGLRGAQDLFQRIFKEQARQGLLPASVDCDFLAHHCVALINGIAIQAVFDLQEWPPHRQLSFIKKALGLI